MLAEVDSEEPAKRALTLGQLKGHPDKARQEITHDQRQRETSKSYPLEVRILVSSIEDALMHMGFSLLTLDHLASRKPSLIRRKTLDARSCRLARTHHLRPGLSRSSDHKDSLHSLLSLHQVHVNHKLSCHLVCCRAVLDLVHVHSSQ